MEAAERAAREARLRSRLRHGYRLMRSRRRRPWPPGMGGYLIVEFATSRVVAGGVPAPFSLSLDQAEAWARRFDPP